MVQGLQSSLQNDEKESFMLKYFLSSLLLFSLITVPVYGAGLVPCGGEGEEECTLCHLWELASRVINFISFNVAIPIAVLLFVVAGFLFLTSGGNQTRLTRAKGIFFNTLIGLVIIFCSWLIVDTIFKTLARDTFVGSWNEFPSCEGGDPDPVGE